MSIDILLSRRLLLSFDSHVMGMNAMANPSQSQDVEYKGPKSNPLDSRKRESGAETTVNTVHADMPEKVASDTGAFVQRVAGAAAPTRSMAGRVIDTAVAAKAGARLLPAALRLFKRYPLRSSLITIGLISAASLLWRDGALRRGKSLT